MAAERGPGTPTATGQSRESDVAVLAAVTGRSAGGGPPSGETGGNGFQRTGQDHRCRRTGRTGHHQGYGEVRIEITPESVEGATIRFLSPDNALISRLGQVVVGDGLVISATIGLRLDLQLPAN
jgi:hypothetical protein